jgi:hypothetical protein
MPRTYPLHHGKYRVEYATIDGLCELPLHLFRKDPPPKYLTITIDPRLRGRAKLEAILHESLHAANPTMSEADVSRIAKEQADIAWGEGYRNKAEIK